MKVAILSESPADEAAVRTLTEAVLGVQIQLVAGPPLRSRGWPSVRNVLPAVMKHLHFRTDAEGLVRVVDSNHSRLHEGPSDQQCQGQTKCRLCEVRDIIVATLADVSPVPGRLALRVAAGIAVPAIEAWYLRGKKSGVSEDAWRHGLATGDFPYTKGQLKDHVYGTDRPSLQLETTRAGEEAARIVQDLPRLEAHFPFGFRTLAAALRSW